MQSSAEPEIVFVDADTLGPDVDITPITSQGRAIVFERTDAGQTAERIKNADVVVANKVKIGASQLRESNVRLVSLTATGTNNVDLDFCKANGIAVTNVAGYSTESVAQHTVAFALQLVGQLSYYQSYVASGHYPTSQMFTHYGPKWFELSGKRWGIVGLGTIGQRVAELARAFGCEVVYHSTSGRNTDQPYTQLSLEELCQTSHVVSVHAPLNDTTKGLIAAKELEQMSGDSVIINMGRGGIIDERALAHAVRNGIIGGAATDVFSTEPPEAGNPLLSLADDHRFLATPHSAWSSVEARSRLIGEIAANIEAFLAGQKRNRVV